MLSDAAMTAVYYPNYSPKSERHFTEMLAQFRTAQTRGDLRTIGALWILSLDVDRQDIVVALGRVEREKGWHI